MRTGPSRWRARSTVIGNRFSRAMRSAASGATGPESCTSQRPDVVDGRDATIVNPGGLEPIAPRCRLRAMPPDRPQTNRAPGSSERGLSAGSGVPSVLVGVRALGGHAENQVRRPGRADAREPLLPRESRPARLHFLPRSASAARTRGEGGLLPRAMPGMPRRSGLPPAAGSPAGPEPRRRLHRCHMPRSRSSDIFHAATTNHRISATATSPTGPVPAEDPLVRPGSLGALSPRADG